MRALRNERGFTLVELLVAAVIAVVVMGAAASALMVSIRTTDSIGVRLAQSHDAQLLSAYLQSDVISAGPPKGKIYRSNGAPDGGAAEGSAAGCSGVPSGTNVIRFEWTHDSTTAPATYNALYRIVDTKLVRYYCVKDQAVSRQVAVAHNVGSVDTAVDADRRVTVTPTVTISGNSYSFALSGIGRQSNLSASSSTTSSSTTSSSTTSSCTTSSSTTTTTLPCTSSGGVASPSSVSRKSNGQLNADFTVTVTTSGTCSAITVRFNTGTGADKVVSLTRTAPSSNTWRVTIRNNDYNTWTVGSHNLTIQGVTNSPSAISFTVT